MTYWISDMRDTGVGGLAALLQRTQWRASDAAPALAGGVAMGLYDPNPLVRMHAVRAAHALNPDATADQQASAIGELALSEQHPVVRSILIDQLWFTIREAAPTVDAVLELLVGMDNTVLADPNHEPAGVVLALVTHLALVARTPFAAETVQRWCQDAPVHATLVEAFTRHARDYLAAAGTTEQRTAFELLDTAARSVLKRWTRTPTEHLAGTTLPPERVLCNRVIT
ncbi:hypothetical protein, partial [Micromonospora sp. CB01531]|uniref:hypothetical protein n=1 Tax=Micromonospora sp. CB01531 TaxID=1718947 RepID=UPI000ADF2701